MTKEDFVLSSVLHKSLWAITQLETETKDRFTSIEIANFLTEEVRKKTSRQAIEYALKMNKKMIHKNEFGYKLMEDGSRELEKIKHKSTIFIDVNSALIEKRLLIEIFFSSLKGTVCICDPYFDLKTTDFIVRNIPILCKIKFLTHKLNNDKPTGIIKRQLEEIKKNGYDIEVRLFQNNELHDRYIIDDKRAWSSGNSLNNLGNKESIIVALGSDIRASIVETFDNRWQQSLII